MKHFTFAAALLAATAIAPAAFAQDAEISYSAGIDTVSEYVFRGLSFGGESLQPYAEASVGGLTVGGWYSAGFGAHSDVQSDEFDLYAGYSVPLDGPVSLDVGVTYYHYPQSGAFLETEGGSAGSYEVYGSVGFGDVALAPSATVYYDFTLETLTLEGSVGHSIELSNPSWTTDLGLTAGHVEADGGGDYQWATASLALNKAINDDVSFFVSGNFSLNSEDNTLDFDRVVDPASEIAFATVDSDNKLWFGTGIAVGF